LEAIKKVENDPILFITVARIFWGERRLEKAMTWFEKAIVADSDYGDGWAWYFKFLQQHGTEVSLSLSKRYHSSCSSMSIYEDILANALFFFFSQDKRSDVISKCVTTEPKHGEAWQAIAKDPVNAHKSTEEILKLVSEAVN
jgi:pre-mRNA-processing factor 6